MGIMLLNEDSNANALIDVPGLLFDSAIEKHLCVVTMMDSTSLSFPCIHVSCAMRMPKSHFSIVLVTLLEVSSGFKPLKFCITSLSLVPSSHLI